jgi:hypothetical protein
LVSLYFWLYCSRMADFLHRVGDPLGGLLVWWS